MKEHPILYSTPMIQAKLAGRKTQTRRVMKHQLTCDHSSHIEADWKDKPIQWSTIGLQHGKAYCACCGNGIQFSKDWSGINCPYGKVGDILWARETFCKDLDVEGGFLFKATNPEAECEDGDGSPWKPSIHMPKEASRIWERITDIRVERLQDISSDDCFAEGIDAENEDYCEAEHYQLGGSPIRGDRPERFAYFALWDKINGPGSVDLNPWVWVITTEILSTTGRPAGLAVSKTEPISINRLITETKN